MELKVWVDGIQRVVCGASLDTTCQDVVITLAHAMGRTGRFTLVEKWRDNERPLTPAESPLRALHKWGEYASEVRFVLCQSETQQRQPSRRPSLDRLDTMLLQQRRKAAGGSSRSSSQDRAPVSSQSLSSLHGDATVKRSLTFSGAHHSQLPEDSSSHSSTGTTSKLRRTNQGPVPHGDMQKSASANPRQPLTTNASGFQQQGSDSLRTVPQPSSFSSAPRSSATSMPPPSSVPHHQQRHQPPIQQQQQHQQQQQQQQQQQPHQHQQQPSPYHPVPPPRRRSTPSPRGVEGTEPSSPVPSAFTGSGSKALRASSVMPPQGGTAHHHPQQPEPKHQQPPPAQPPRSASLPSHQPLPHQVYRPQPRALPPASLSAAPPAPLPPTRKARHPLTGPPRSPEPPPLPVSSPPPLPPHGKPAALLDPQATLAAIEASILASDHSRQASLEMEEYDLDRNFPDSHQSLGMRGSSRGQQPPPPALGTEYRLDGGFVGVSGGHGEGVGSAAQQQQQLEGEHARLLELVHLQQEKIKTHESQLSLVNTEIARMEEKEQAYEEQLQAVMEELLLHEGRQRELEAELGELEDPSGRDWAAALQGEQQRQLDLTLQIATVKAQILDCQHRLLDAQGQEEELSQQLRQAREERERREREEAEEEEAARRKKAEAEEEEKKRLQEEVGELQKVGAECEASLASVEAELGQAERALEEKRKEVRQLEASLQEEEKEEGEVKVKQAALPQPPPPSPPPPLLPAPSPDLASLRDAGEKVLRILEGRASPRPPGHSRTASTDNPPASSDSTTATPPTVPVSLKPPGRHAGGTPTTLQLLSALAPHNQSGVWV